MTTPARPERRRRGARVLGGRGRRAGSPTSEALAAAASTADLLDLGAAASAMRRRLRPERRGHLHRRPQRQLHQRLRLRLPLLRVLPRRRATPTPTSSPATSSPRRSPRRSTSTAPRSCCRAACTPTCGIEWYEGMLREHQGRLPRIHVHGFGPPEIVHIAKLSGISTARGPRAAARRRARLAAGRRRRDPRRPRARPRLAQEGDERRVARRHARGAQARHLDDRHDDVRRRSRPLEERVEHLRARPRGAGRGGRRRPCRLPRVHPVELPARQHRACRGRVRRERRRR